MVSSVRTLCLCDLILNQWCGEANYPVTLKSHNTAQWTNLISTCTDDSVKQLCD